MFGIGKLVGNIAQKMFGSGAGGNLISGVAGGLASFFTGDIFGGINGAMKAFQGLSDDTLGLPKFGLTWITEHLENVCDPLKCLHSPI